MKSKSSAHSKYEIAGSDPAYVFRPNSKRRIKAVNELNRLLARLEAIADFPHPDFPEEDLQGEVKRAWRIIIHLQELARYAKP